MSVLGALGGFAATSSSLGSVGSKGPHAVSGCLFLPQHTYWTWEDFRDTRNIPFCVMPTRAKAMSQTSRELGRAGREGIPDPTPPARLPKFKGRQG